VLLAAALGFAAATVLGYPLTSRWLVIAYILVALLLVDGFGERLPWVKAVRAAALASPDDRPSGELKALIESPRAKIGGPLSGVLWLAVVYTMVFKP